MTKKIDNEKIFKEVSEAIKAGLSKDYTKFHALTSDFSIDEMMFICNLLDIFNNYLQK